MSGPGLAAKLRDVQVGLRADLETTRMLFRGEVAYVVRDPLTLASHRLGIPEYQALVALRPDRTLGKVFEELVASGRFEAAEEESFYAFVFQLHRLGFLALPLSDEKLLAKRAEAKLEQRRTKWLTAFFYYPIPLWNPDPFLQRTALVGRALFSWPAACVWFAALALAAFVAARNWGEFSRPIGDVFSSGNLPLLWITLIALKVFHEFGHAYATRRFGGAVPEMGVNLVIFTPAAYVDASSSWGFRQHRQRLLVCLAGMYVELFLAALALLAWSVLEPGLLRNLAHNVVLLASVVTVGFNANPLTRFDGYFALCDVLQLPNLYQRASEHVTGLCKRLFLGLRARGSAGSAWLGLLLTSYGLGASIYRVLLVCGISAAIASRYYSAGVLVLAVPPLLTLLAVAYVAARRAIAREVARRPASRRPGSDRPRSSRPGWSEPPSLRYVWQALEPRQAPLMLHWIVLGTLVTAGVGLVALGVALYTGHWLGLDFAAADEADVSSNVPLVFLAIAVGLAFPAAGYLVARASGTKSVLEPALVASLAVFGAVLFLSVTTPIAAVFALALTPIAFILASAGAWLGIGR
jgi:hypothetical protein